MKKRLAKLSLTVRDGKMKQTGTDPKHHSLWLRDDSLRAMHNRAVLLDGEDG